MVQNKNAAEKKEESGSIDPAHCIICRQFRAAEFQTRKVVVLKPRRVPDGSTVAAWLHYHFDSKLAADKAFDLQAGNVSAALRILRPFNEHLILCTGESQKQIRNAGSGRGALQRLQPAATAQHKSPADDSQV
ncbi:hypothetical protein EVAR_48313_1 [Eumeta japonica]|uniref:Uncharacterized protein n=1 Tax=Eumeta variegata TaxID=151549 RepID=A0A4C1WLH4_EUMVA|nr:hypothetical protein EVAR_48313_1 [Eumeta japonica]